MQLVVPELARRQTKATVYEPSSVGRFIIARSGAREPPTTSTFCLHNRLVVLELTGMTPNALAIPSSLTSPWGDVAFRPRRRHPRCRGRGPQGCGKAPQGGCELGLTP